MSLNRGPTVYNLYHSPLQKRLSRSTPLKTINISSGPEPRRSTPTHIKSTAVLVHRVRSPDWPGSPSTLLSKPTNRRFKRTCIMITLVIIVFVVTWSPYFFLKFLYLLKDEHPIVKTVLFHQIVFITSILPPVLNPIVYICQFPAMKDLFRKARKWLCDPREEGIEELGENNNAVIAVVAGGNDLDQDKVTPRNVQPMCVTHS
eukprot:sb/3470573/